ncbi:MAG: GAF domain-containing sensor histidine kinase [Anaerolineales bacterium]|nr:GAF domain-containing sensor histidine kinase [Anaerolineales bacterium]
MKKTKAHSTLLNSYQKLINISCDLASELDLNILLSKIVSAASEVSDSEEASILMFDPAKNTLYFQAATNLDTQLKRGLVVPLEESIAGWIVTNQQPVIVDNPQKDKRHFDVIETITNIKCDSLLGIPLLSKGKIIGVLEVINKRGGSFTQEDQDVLLALGAQASVAIENSRLFLQSDLIGEFVHQIRTPLSALNAATHLIKSNRVDDLQKKKMIDIMEAEIEALSDMSSSFLDLARLQSGRKQYSVNEFNIRELIIECYDIFYSDAQQHTIKFILDIPETLPRVLGDRKQLKHALTNLLNNAVKFNHEGGEIKLRAIAKKKEVIISLSDSGLGIPEDEQDHIFEKFYRVRSHRDQVPGTGLGLSVVKQIITDHGGSISLTSEVNVGTTFTVTLPAES